MTFHSFRNEPGWGPFLASSHTLVGSEPAPGKFGVHAAGRALFLLSPLVPICERFTVQG